MFSGGWEKMGWKLWKYMASILSTFLNHTGILIKNICYHKQDLSERSALFSIPLIKLSIRLVHSEAPEAVTYRETSSAAPAASAGCSRSPDAWIPATAAALWP